MVINCPLPNWKVKVSTKETYVGMAKGMYSYKQTSIQFWELL